MAELEAQDVYEGKEVDTPWNIAKFLGCRPQRIYMLIKQGKIPSYKGETAQEVNINDVRRALGEQNTRRGRPKGAKTGRPGSGVSGRGARVKEQDVVSWPRVPKGGREVARVVRITGDDDEPDSSLTFLRALNRDDIPFASASLERKVGQGLITVEDPIALLQLLVDKAHFSGHAALEEKLLTAKWEWEAVIGAEDRVTEANDDESGIGTLDAVGAGMVVDADQQGEDLRG